MLSARLNDIASKLKFLHLDVTEDESMSNQAQHHCVTILTPNPLLIVGLPAVCYLLSAVCCLLSAMFGLCLVSAEAHAFGCH
jgi:hypothetical protein